MIAIQAQNIDLHDLWVALSRAKVPGSKWAEWNRYARLHGVERAIAELQTAQRDTGEDAP